MPTGAINATRDARRVLPSRRQKTSMEELRTNRLIMSDLAESVAVCAIPSADVAGDVAIGVASPVDLAEDATIGVVSPAIAEVASSADLAGVASSADLAGFVTSQRKFKMECGVGILVLSDCGCVCDDFC